MKKIYLGGCSLAVLFSAPAMAQETAQASVQQGEQATDASSGLADIIVTAQARSQSLKDVPVSVSVVDSTVLQDKSMLKLEDVQYFVPNFSLTEVGITTSVFVRGIGSGENQGFEQSVGLYIDGVHYGRAKEVQAPFLDLDRVEVLRGPQSILFGKNSVAGALSITTAKPTHSFKASLMTSYEFNAKDFLTEGYVSGPITDRLRARVAVRYRHSDGYDFNVLTGQYNPRNRDLAVRGTVEYDVTDNLTATFKAEVNRFDRTGRTGETYVSDPIATGPFTGLTYGQVLYNVFGQNASVLDEKQDGRRAASGEFSNNKLQTYSLGLDWKLGDYTLKSTSAFTRLKYSDNCDCDFIGANIFSAGFQETYDQSSQEIRLISPDFEHYNFIVGAYFESATQNYADQIVVPSNSMLVPLINSQAPGFGNLIANTEAARTARVHSDVLSAFAQVNWKVVPDVTLQLGGRFTHEKKNGRRGMNILGVDGNPLPVGQAAAPLVYAGLFGITSENLAQLGPQGAFYINQLGQLPVSGSLTDNRFSPDIKLKWDIGHNAMVYATWARGYKSGGFDFRANNRSVSPTMADSFQFRDEQATNYEIGGKFGLGRKIEINLAAFYTQYKDLQVAIFDGILGYNVGNAAKADVKGLEFDGRWAVTRNLNLSGGVAYTDFKFKDYPNGQCYFGQAANTDLNGDGVPDHCSYDGKSNQLVAKFKGNLTADFKYPIFNGYNLDTTADLIVTSKYNASPLLDPKGVQAAYQLVNLRFALSPDDGKWQIALLGKNLFDKRPLQYAGALPLAAGTFGSDGLTGLFLQGRQISLQARVNF